MNEILRNEQIYQLEHIVAAMPGTIYWKDTEGRLLGCNQNQIKFLGISKKNIIGKNTLEIGGLCKWSKGATNLVHQNSLSVVKNFSAQYLEEILFIKETPQTVLSFKSPLITAEKTICGLAGVSILTTNHKNSKKIESYLEKTANLITFKLSTTTIFPKLAKRELECLHFIIRGLTAKQIGKVLNLSFRTVESYIENMKYKFNCSSRSELIGKAIDLGYIHLTVKNPHNFKFDTDSYNFLGQ